MAQINRTAAAVHRSPQPMPPPFVPGAPLASASTFEGAATRNEPALAQLRRTVLACLLWEDSFYESGEAVADRIARLALDRSIAPADLVALAGEARHRMKLRHAPLWLLAAMTRRPDCKPLLAEAIARTIKRADEPAELVAMYLHANGRTKAKGANAERVAPKLPKQMRKGIAAALPQFDEYQLAKWRGRDKPVRLVDIFKLVRPRPSTDEMAALWGRVVRDELKTPDTWEVALSAGGNKRETFERLLRDGKLGYMALLKNLRGMEEAGVDHALIEDAIRARRGAHVVLPFRFYTAAEAAPTFRGVLTAAMFAQVGEGPKLRGKTAVLIDISSSMRTARAGKGTVNCATFAGLLAALLPCEHVEMWAFDTGTRKLPSSLRRMDLVDWTTRNAQGGTDIEQAVRTVNREAPGFDRLVLITDEQSTTRIPAANMPLAYVINPAGYNRAVARNGEWIDLAGFSEGVIRYIVEIERERSPRPDGFPVIPGGDGLDADDDEA